MIIYYKILVTVVFILGITAAANVFLDLGIGRYLEKYFDLWMLGLVAISAIDAIRLLWTLF